MLSDKDAIAKYHEDESLHERASYKSLDQTVTFDVKVTMKRRWVPCFLTMLSYMQQLGSWGSSRTVSLFADGDGDFRPIFTWQKGMVTEFAKPIEDRDGDRTYDAG